MMIDRRDLRQRWLLGTGLPFLGGLLLWMLWPFPMHVMMLTQGGWNLGGLSGRSFLLIGAMMLLCGIGAAWLARGGALLVVPLALLIGWLLGINVFVSPSSANYLLRYMMPVLVEAEIGALLGLVVARWGVPMGQRALVAVQQHVKAELHAAPTPIFPASAEASKTRGGKQETIPASSPEPTKEEVVPPVPEQDDIARVLAQMQRDYAQTAKHEPHDGTHQTL